LAAAADVAVGAADGAADDDTEPEVGTTTTLPFSSVRSAARFSGLRPGIFGLVETAAGAGARDAAAGRDARAAVALKFARAGAGLVDEVAEAGVGEEAGGGDPAAVAAAAAAAVPERNCSFSASSAATLRRRSSTSLRMRLYCDTGICFMSGEFCPAACIWAARSAARRTLAFVGFTVPALAARGLPVVDANAAAPGRAGLALLTARGFAVRPATPPALLRAERMPAFALEGLISSEKRAASSPSTGLAPAPPLPAAMLLARREIAGRDPAALPLRDRAAETPRTAPVEAIAARIAPPALVPR
jgi:hypothetical protein